MSQPTVFGFAWLKYDVAYRVVITANRGTRKETDNVRVKTNHCRILNLL